MHAHFSTVFLLSAGLVLRAGAATLEDYRRIFDEESTKMEAVHTATTNAALQQYVTGVREAKVRAQNAGDLEGLMACRAEVERLARQRTVPEADTLAIPASIQILRRDYRAALRDANRERDAGMRKLLTSYIKRLDGLKKKLVKAEKIGRALAVKKEVQRAVFLLAVVQTENPPPSPKPGPAVPARPAAEPRKSRPLGTRPFGEHWYKVYDEAVSWHEAKRRCEERGGYLACIGGRLENDFVAKLVGGKHVWLGGTDEVREGQWRWVSGETFAFSHWGSGEPNNRGGDQDYLTMGHPRKDTWNDLERYNPKWAAGYVCEWEH